MNNATLKKEISSSPKLEVNTVKSRTAEIGSRSLKAESKIKAILQLISFLDLTTLEGTDTPNRVSQLVSKALRPHPLYNTPTCAAVCVYTDMVASAREAIDLQKGKLELASVSSYFPSGRSNINSKILDTQNALKAGATEIDIVIDRGAYLKGDYLKIFEETSELVKISHKAGARVKTILEVGELPLYDDVAKASRLALLAGSDFIKTSTGKHAISSTPEYAYVMTKVLAQYNEENKVIRGFKPAGGVKTTKDAISLYLITQYHLGDEFMDPKFFRIGASTLLTDLLLQYEKQLSPTKEYKSTKYLGAL